MFTKAEEAPWFHGLVESYAVAKTIDNVKYDLEVALACSMSNSCQKFSKKI